MASALRKIWTKWPALPLGDSEKQKRVMGQITAVHFAVTVVKE